MARADGNVTDFPALDEDLAGLQRYRERMEAFFEALPEAVVLTDLERRIRRVNAAVTRVFGYTEEELLGEAIEIFHVDREACLEQGRQWFDPDAYGGSTYETEYCRKSGERFPSETVVAVIRDPGGESLGYLHIIRDITRRVEADEAMARQAEALASQNMELLLRNKELDDFAHIASHDLQEPLRKLVAFSELLAQDLPDDLTGPALQDLRFIQDAAQRMHRLVRGLLALSRVGRAALSVERLALSEVADAATRALTARLAEARATVLRDDLPEIDADRSLLTQVYQNLIGNALKFVSSDARPEVRLTAERVDGEWVLGVRDNGIGIDAKYADQVFAPCKRLNGPDEYEGSGLGLAVCHRIVAAHGGRIWVESEPDRGAHFRFTLQATS